MLSSQAQVQRRDTELREEFHESWRKDVGKGRRPRASAAGARGAMGAVGREAA